ncbi:MAG TPA: glycosyltransferase family 87 protein [Candidatus Limnocylindrales bacterium]|nr:glycosyltransferase family 87 protein [Candidatus Limnocylindrales bacterium]
MTVSPRFILVAIGIGWAVAVFVTFTRMGNPVDAWCYYGFDPSNTYDPNGCFLYSPPVAQVMGVIQAIMPFEAFTFLLRAVETIALVAVAGPATFFALFIPAVAIELNAVNVNLLIVVAVLLGFRYPFAWAFVILTKLSPGVGLLWFAVRREWRNLAIAAGATLLIAGGSYILAPDLWRQYIEQLGREPDESIFVIGWRLPLAALVVIWGARTDRRWTMIVAVFLAMPRWYYLTPVILVGLFPLVRLARPLPGSRWFRSRTAQPAAAETSDGLTARAPSS